MVARQGKQAAEWRGLYPSSDERIARNPERGQEVKMDKREKSPCAECANYGFGCASPITAKTWIENKNLFRDYLYPERPDCFEMDIEE